MQARTCMECCGHAEIVYAFHSIAIEKQVIKESFLQY